MLTSIVVNGVPRVYYFSSDGYIHELAEDVPGWTHKPISAIANAPASASQYLRALTATTLVDQATGVAYPRVYYTAGYLSELASGAGANGWTCTSPIVVSIPGGNEWPAPADPGAQLASTNLAGDPRLYYLTSGNIIELAWLGDHWNLTTLATNNVGVALTATTAGGNPRVYYLGNVGLYEEAWLPGWSARELGGWDPDSIPSGSLTSTTLNVDFPRVYGFGGPQNGPYTVLEWAWLPEWNITNVVSAAGAPPPDVRCGLASTAVDGKPRVYYLASGFGSLAIIELSWDGGWSYRQITDDGGPLAAAGSALTALSVDGGPRVYYVSGLSGGVVEARYFGDTDKFVCWDITGSAGGPTAAVP